MRLSVIIIIFLLVVANLCYSQKSSPGGVGGVRLWYVTEKNGNRNTLKDISGNKWPDFAFSQDITKNRNINFHPAVFFNGSNYSQLYENIVFNQGSIIGLFYPVNSGNTNKNFLSVKFNNEEIALRQSAIQLNGQTKFNFGNAQKRNTLLVQGPSTTKENSMKTAVLHSSTGKLYNSIWGEEKKTTVHSNFIGYSPEFFLYNRVLSPLEFSQIESYLAIKYGITLDTSYISSNGEPLWDIKDINLKRFHHRICAIGRDTLAGIWQPKSNSTYEESPFTAYDFDANKTPTVGNFIPKEDSSSLYRSLTISFKDKSMNGVGEGKFLFWGDDSLSVNEQDYYQYNTTEFPNLFLMKRNWIMLNKDAISQPTKVVIAGSDYRKPSMFSNKLYHPYDYQLYRYILVKWNNLDKQRIEKVILCDYFGRDHLNSGKFNTRSIVWDNVSWISNTSITCFTFGRVPILNFLQIGKEQNVLTDLKYPYYPKLPITASTHFNLTAKPIVFKKGEPNTAYFWTSEGVSPLVPKLYVLTLSGKKEIKGAIIHVKGGVLTPEITIEQDDNNDETTDSSLPPSSSPATSNNVTNKMAEILRNKPIIQQKRVGFRVSKLLPTPATYVIEITDKIGQFTSLSFKTTFTDNTLVNN